MAHPQQHRENPLANYQFSSDEIRVLRECNTESFFQRSLPLGTGFGLAAYFGVKNGYLRPSIKYGSVPKVVMSVIVGYFVGKFSYQQRCAEKIMQIPNSKLGELLRQRKQGGSGVMGSFATEQNLGVGMALAPFSSNADVYSDESLLNVKRESSLNLDTDHRPKVAELDELYRPSLDNPQPFLEQEIPIEPKIPGTSYEELRKRNREEYLKKQQGQYNRLSAPADTPVLTHSEVPRSPLNENSSSQGLSNKYGDRWE